MNKSQKLQSKNYSLSLVTMFAQFCALLPVNSVNENPQFKWLSFHVFYTMFIIIIMSVFLFFEVVYISTKSSLNLSVINNIITKVTIIAMLVVHISLGRKWPKIKKFWVFNDIIMDKNYGMLTNFNLRIKICMGIYFLLISVLYVNSHVVLILKKTNILMNPFFSFVFNYIPFNYPLGIVFTFVYTIGYYILHFNDFFIIITSMYVALRFKQIRNRLELFEKQPQEGAFSIDYWFKMRQDYNRLSYFCEHLDEGINSLILICFMYNIYFIVIYLFCQLMIEVQGSEIAIFYVFFPVLVIKLFAVCLYTSWVNDESLEPINILNSVSSRIYNAEIGRWLVQISFDNVAFTGGKMFKITRSIFLSVVSIVVTYELVVMQFYGFSSSA